MRVDDAGCTLVGFSCPETEVSFAGATTLGHCRMEYRRRPGRGAGFEAVPDRLASGVHLLGNFAPTGAETFVLGHEQGAQIVAGTDGSDAFIRRVDVTGQLLWEHTFTGATLADVDVSVGGGIALVLTHDAFFSFAGLDHDVSAPDLGGAAFSFDDDGGLLHHVYFTYDDGGPSLISASADGSFALGFSAQSPFSIGDDTPSPTTADPAGALHAIAAGCALTGRLTASGQGPALSVFVFDEAGDPQRNLTADSTSGVTLTDAKFLNAEGELGLVGIEGSAGGNEVEFTHISGQRIGPALVSGFGDGTITFGSSGAEVLSSEHAV